MGFLKGLLNFTGEMANGIVKEATGIDVKKAANTMSNGGTLNDLMNSIVEDTNGRKEEAKNIVRKKLRTLSDEQIERYYYSKKDTLNADGLELIKEEMDRRGISWD